MATKTLCEYWHDLLYGKIPYLAPFYAEFVNNRTDLVDHLDSCRQNCKSKLFRLSPLTTVTALKNMSDADFFTTITNLRSLAIANAQKNQTP